MPPVSEKDKSQLPISPFDSIELDSDGLPLPTPDMIAEPVRPTPIENEYPILDEEEHLDEKVEQDWVSKLEEALDKIGDLKFELEQKKQMEIALAGKLKEVEEERDSLLGIKADIARKEAEAIEAEKKRKREEFENALAIVTNSIPDIAQKNAIYQLITTMVPE